jgi:hypothetical protein
LPGTARAKDYTLRPGMLSTSSLKRVVKFAMQFTTFSPTICPSLQFLLDQAKCFLVGRHSYAAVNERQDYGTKTQRDMSSFQTSLNWHIVLLVLEVEKEIPNETRSKGEYSVSG